MSRVLPALAALFLAATTGCSSPTAQHAALLAEVCKTDEVAIDERGRLDLGLVSVVPPPGYEFAGAAHEVHGGVYFMDAGKRRIGLGNGYWGPSSFREKETGVPVADCRFDVDGIPIEVYHFTGSVRGTLGLGAIVRYPVRPEGAMVMQSLAGAEIHPGDVAYARSFREFLHSIRRGDATRHVRAPGSISDRRRELPATPPEQ